MRNYIFEKVNNAPKYFNFAGVDVVEVDPCPEHIDLQSVLSSVEKLLPSKFFKSLKQIRIEHIPMFDKKDANALYDDGIFYITNKQDNAADIIDDIIHEFAHHVEMLYPEEIYADQKIKKEFLKKRAELEFELRSEGYWTKEYNFMDLEYDRQFDVFLYKRIGGNLLKMVTSGMYIRPYASVSLREYFGTGFEEYFLGSKQKLKKISPELYNKIDELVNN